MPEELAIVIPAYNESARFDFEKLQILGQNGKFITRIYIVNDGSTDDFSIKVLNFINKNEENYVELLQMESNRGKSEALRHGCKIAVQNGHKIITIADADFSSPPKEILGLAEILSLSDLDIVLGSRIRQENNNIKSNIFRFIQGKFFSHMVQFFFSLNLKDTQCGYKAFRNTTALRDALETKFQDQWLFDIEIILRMKTTSRELRYLEVPLKTWVHQEGSKIKMRHIFKTLISLITLWRNYRKPYNFLATT